jgi:glutamine amidotransferase
MSRIGIVDYGMGNLRSVANALRMAGADPVIIGRPEELAACARLIVPGVGAFTQAMQHLTGSGMSAALEQVRQAGRPILGICLGMQLMCRSSQEDAPENTPHPGLGWIDARVLRFPSNPGFKVPHMGWDDVRPAQTGHPLLDAISDGSDFYFVHSYYVDCAIPGDVLLKGDYGVPYCAAFAHANVAGVQFHPEKSQQVGLRLLKNFLAWNPC